MWCNKFDTVFFPSFRIFLYRLGEELESQLSRELGEIENFPSSISVVLRTRRGLGFILVFFCGGRRDFETPSACIICAVRVK